MKRRVLRALLRANRARIVRHARRNPDAFYEREHLYVRHSRLRSKLAA